MLHTHRHRHRHRHTHTHVITHTHTHRTHTHTHPTHTHTSLTSLTHITRTPHTHTHTTSLTHTHTLPDTLAFAWQARDLVHCKGVGCTPWRPSGVPWSPPLCRWLLRGRRGTWCTAKGSDVRLAFVWRPSGIPLASLWRPLVSAALPVAFAW